VQAVDAAEASSNDKTSQAHSASATQCQAAGGRSAECGKVGPATHSLPFLERRSAPFFHEDVTPPSSMRPQPVRRAGFGRRGERGERSFGGCGPLLRCAGQPLLPPHRPAQIRRRLALVTWFVVVVRCRCRCPCPCLSSLACGVWTLQR
jgi:hypothetical protein